MAEDTLEPRSANRFPHSNYSKADRSLLDGPFGADLQLAIDNLYAEFQNAALSLPLRYCPHCFTDADAQYVSRTPLRELTLADITFILPKAITTLGVATDFNYFLPRIFEAWALQGHYLIEALPSRLKMARESSWSEQQLTSVVQFITTYIYAVNAIVDNDSAAFDLESIMTELRDAIPELPVDLKPVLRK